jgi:RNA polymerase subunit RPABC4/transcription elongation factor Spt4
MEYAILAGLVGGLWAFLLWLSIIVWIYRDVRDRTRDLALQVIAMFMALMFFPGFNVPGLALYLMLRPRETLDEAYARSLEEEALLREIGDEAVCPSCRRFVERGWRVCAFCQTQLKDSCTGCDQLLSFNWVVCPYCGGQAKDAALPQSKPAKAKPRARTNSPAPATHPQEAAAQNEESEPLRAEGLTPPQQ